MVKITITSDMKPLKIAEAVLDALDKMGDDNQMAVTQRTSKKAMQEGLALQFSALFGRLMSVELTEMRVEDGVLVIDTILTYNEENEDTEEGMIALINLPVADVEPLKG